MPVTKEQAQMIATLALASRPTVARNWDHAGVMAAIAKVRHLHLAEVILATIRAADDPSLDTPGAIGNTRTSCWRERNRNRAVEVVPFERETTCGICGYPESRCRANPHAEHEFESVVEVQRNAANREHA